MQHRSGGTINRANRLARSATPTVAKAVGTVTYTARPHGLNPNGLSRTGREPNCAAAIGRTSRYSMRLDVFGHAAR